MGEEHLRPVVEKLAVIFVFGLYVGTYSAECRHPAAIEGRIT